MAVYIRPSCFLVNIYRTVTEAKTEGQRKKSCRETEVLWILFSEYK